MIRIAVLPYARPGITGGAMLGLGRAIGETIAVVLVIGNAPVVGSHLISQGYTLAAVIANEFGEAANSPIHSSALFAAGLVLFVLTLIINLFARWFVLRGERGMRGGVKPETTEPEPAPGAGATPAGAEA
jgi:phosphate transport system permease protein